MTWFCGRTPEVMVGYFKVYRRGCLKVNANKSKMMALGGIGVWRLCGWGMIAAIVLVQIFGACFG